MGVVLVVALLVPVAWALGTFPSALLVARTRGRDVLREGSGNPGATNVARLLGWRAGLLVLVLDFLKGMAAAGVGLAVGGRAGAYALGVAAVLGHTFPILRRGGKGVAAAGGALALLYPLISLALLVVWVVVARVLHKASLASLLVAVAFPVAVALAGYARWEVVAVAAIALLIVARHAGNIRRLVRHEEMDLGSTPGR